MQSYHRVHVQFRRKDRQQLSGMLTKGRESARVLRRAWILRQLDSGQKATQVAANVGVAAKTVRAVGRRYEEQGLESALYEKARPGKQRALDVGQSQRIIAMVCGSTEGDSVMSRFRPRSPNLRLKRCSLQRLGCLCP